MRRTRGRTGVLGIFPAKLKVKMKINHTIIAIIAEIIRNIVVLG
jgi:hypothetical protein